MKSFHLSTLRYDLPAALVVFLVALPLCMGIALASDAPLISGVISGVIGGVVVGLLSSSHTSVSGPAAGLTAVVVSAIYQLKYFDVFLLAVLIAGGMQVLLGLLKAGFIANFIPSNVIKGLLAAIGIILILKQIPYAMGLEKQYYESFDLLQFDVLATWLELREMVHHMEPGSVLLSSISILLLVFWKQTPLRNLTFFPPSLFVVLMGVLLNFAFKYTFPSLHIEPAHLVNIPKINGLHQIIISPDFSAINNYRVWSVALTIAIIATVETLLNLEAVENIDPFKRKASPNRELIAQGIGNISSGLIGGIPVTSVIVRSSVNITAGGRSKMVTIIHGIFLLLSVVFLSKFLNYIPLASLAVILLLTGYKLANIQLFKEMYRKGVKQYIPFFSTVFAIIYTDLLIGVFTGLIVSVFFILRRNIQNPFFLQRSKTNETDSFLLVLPFQVSFLNKVSLKTTLWSIPDNSYLHIDARPTSYIDPDVIEILDEFRRTVAPIKNIKLHIEGLKENYEMADKVNFFKLFRLKKHEQTIQK